MSGASLRGAPYRADETGAQARRAQALAAWQVERAAVGELEALVAARWARAATAAAVVLAFATLAVARPLEWIVPALVVVVLPLPLYHLGRMLLARRLLRIARFTDDPLGDADRLRAGLPSALLRAAARRAEPWASAATMALGGLAVPLAGSASELMGRFVSLGPVGILAFVCAEITLASWWLQPIFLTFAAAKAWRWARQPTSRLEPAPGKEWVIWVLLVTALLIVVGDEPLGRLALIGIMAQTAMLALGRSRARRRLVAERELLEESQAT